MSSKSFPVTQITEERTVVFSLDDLVPVRDTVSTTTATTLPATTSTTSHLTDADTSAIQSTKLPTRNPPHPRVQPKKSQPTSLPQPPPSLLPLSKEPRTSRGWCMITRRRMGAGRAVGSGVEAVGSKVAEMAPSGEQVRNAGSAVGSGAYNTGTAVGPGAYNASAAVGNTAVNAGSAAANTVSNTASAVGNTAVNGANYIKDTVKEYLPTSVVGSSPSTTLASIEADEKRYSQTSLPLVTDSPVPSSHSKTTTHTLPLQEYTHTGEGAASLSSAKTHDLATQGGVADSSREGIARLPGEYATGSLATRDHVGRSESGVGALPGYMGESNVAAIPLGSPESGADSQASTRTLAGSIAPSTSTSVSGSGSGFESSTHPSTGTNPSTTTAHPSTTSAAATYLATATNPSPTASSHPITTTASTEADNASPKKGTMDEAKDLFLSMQTQSGDQSASKLPGTQTHKQEGFGRQQSIDTPMSTRATIGRGTPVSPSMTSVGAGSASNTGAYPRTSTTGGSVSGQHPDMPTAPSAPHTGRRAGATEARYTSSSSGAGVSGAGIRHTDVGKEKVTLKDKIKGEAEVISGKIGGNEEKVEVGKRMMGKN